jgi:catechol 2,3-dioxygenase
MGITVSGVGHAVLRVRDLDRAVGFYRRVLGLREVARRDFGEGPMAFLSTGNTHHDLALVQAAGAHGSPGTAPGLHHLGWRIGDDLAALRTAQVHLAEQGIPILGILDHRVSQGIYINDPDGNLLELYVDADSLLWRTAPALVATSEPLAL